MWGCMIIGNGTERVTGMFAVGDKVQMKAIQDNPYPDPHLLTGTIREIMDDCIVFVNWDAWADFPLVHDTILNINKFPYPTKLLVKIDV